MVSVMYHNMALARVINPINYGLKECRTNIERYNVLYKCHTEAINNGEIVSYRGIDTVYIEIPPGAKSIPLSYNNNFNNCVLVVKNKVKDIPLFTLSNKVSETGYWENVDKNSILGGVGNKLIIFEDTIPWINDRKGYGYGHIRKDILYVRKGQVQNNTIASYDNSRPRYYICDIQNEKKKIENLTFIRDSLSTCITYLLRIENEYNVFLNNITTKTPASVLYRDAIIRIENCYNVVIKNITINGTYSLKDKYGYGISLVNVGKVLIKNMFAEANWGVFGNNNVNGVKLYNCDINRFDVHCYGRDLLFKNCIFRDLYNQISSIYGSVVFANCSFINCIPLVFEPSYNAYTKFDLSFKNCIWEVGQKKNHLISAGYPCGEINPRPELRQKCWPNISISGMSIKLPEGINDLYLFKVRYDGECFSEIDYINTINIKKVRFSKSNENYKLFLANKYVKFTNQIQLNGLAIYNDSAKGFDEPFVDLTSFVNDR